MSVRDEQSGLSGVEIEIRDPQGRWKKVARAYEANGPSFTTTITWDRRFGDGTLAPIGTYQGVFKAFDRAGNVARETASIVIPAPNLTPTLWPTHTPLPTPTYLSSLTPDTSRLATKTAIPTRTPVISAFQSPNRQSNNLQSNNLQSNNLQFPTPLWGAAALTVIAGATGLALAARRRREEEEARQAAEVRAQAEAKTEALRGQKEHQRLLERIQNYLLSQQMKKAQEAAARQAQHRAREAKIEREEQKEEAAWEAWKSRSQTLAAQRAEQQRQQAAAAYQAYRQGERAEAQEKSWWQKAGDAIHGIISALPSIVDGINAISEIINVSKASRQVNYVQRGNQIIIRGPRSARQVLGLNPYTNRINIENASHLLVKTRMTRAFRSVSSSWTLASVLLNVGVDYYSYRTGEYDQREFGAALLFDTAATIISAAVAGLVAGAVAGAIAGTPALGIGAVPGAVIGGIAGAVAGIGMSLALNYYVRDWYIATASHGWDWLGR